MDITKPLYRGYILLKDSLLSVRHDTDAEAICYFSTTLNSTRPKSGKDVILYRFVRSMYHDDKGRFLAFIKNTTYECLVLWTEPMAILKQLKLNGIIKCKWNYNDTSYYISKFKSNKHVYRRHYSNDTYEHPIVSRLRNKPEEPVIDEEKKDTPVDNSVVDILPMLSPGMSSDKESNKRILWGDY
jgi:hypothetical protein